MLSLLAPDDQESQSQLCGQLVYIIKRLLNHSDTKVNLNSVIQTTENDDEDSKEEDHTGAGMENKKRLGRNRNLLPEDEHKLLLKMRHIHRQLGHPCKRV